MGESTRPQVKPRYFLRYTPVSVADTRCCCQQQNENTYWDSHCHHHNYYCRLLLLLAVWNKPAARSFPETVARREHRPKTERKTRRERGRRPRDTDRREKEKEIKKKDEQPPQNAMGWYFAEDLLLRGWLTPWPTVWATEAKKDRLLRPLLSASSGAGSAGAGAEGGGGGGAGARAGSRQAPGKLVQLVR